MHARTARRADRRALKAVGGSALSSALDQIGKLSPVRSVAPLAGTPAAAAAQAGAIFGTEKRHEPAPPTILKPDLALRGPDGRIAKSMPFSDWRKVDIALEILKACGYSWTMICRHCLQAATIETLGTTDGKIDRNNQSFGCLCSKVSIRG